MAHYAFLDSNNIVIDIIVGKDEGEDGIDWEQYYGEFRGLVCKRTSYNTYRNTHENNGTPYRVNYAGIGFTYDVERDAFIPPKPFNSWTLNESTCSWTPPIPVPIEEGKFFRWHEEDLAWHECVIECAYCSDV
jgi:hypothetical protein